MYERRNHAVGHVIKLTLSEWGSLNTKKRGLREVLPPKTDENGSPGGALPIKTGKALLARSVIRESQAQSRAHLSFYGLIFYGLRVPSPESLPVRTNPEGGRSEWGWDLLPSTLSTLPLAPRNKEALCLFSLFAPRGSYPARSRWQQVLVNKEDYGAGRLRVTGFYAELAVSFSCFLRP